MRAAAVLAAVLCAACSTPEPARVRPVEWAQPVLGGAIGNWHQVAPGLLRCAQPSADGMRALAAFGVRTVVNLREYHSDADEAPAAGLRLVELPNSAGELGYADLVAAVAAIETAEKPVAVHCWHGADRTGAVIAAWRIAVQGWTPAAALDEMVHGGFGHAAVWGNLRELVGGLDAERLRADVAGAIGAARAAR